MVPISSPHDDAPAAPPSGAPLLELTGFSKSFAGFKALDQVELTLRAGEAHALLGENGAGKSTLIKCMTGVVHRDAGRLSLDGVEIAPRSAEEAVKAGIATVYQEVNLAPNLSVAQNLFLGRQPTRFGLVREGEMRRRATAVLAEFDLDLDVAAPLERYSVAVQHIVAIARAVDQSARVLILDEPTASLDAHEVEILFAVLRKLKARGIGIVFVTHFLDQVYAICERITVLRNGRLAGSATTAELPRLDLVRMMLGRELAQATAPAERAPLAAREVAGAREAAFATFENYGKAGYVAPFDLALRPGHVVGLAGLLGSGRTETTRLIFGAAHADSGTATVDGARVALASPAEALHLGFGYCPEERKTEGIVAELTVRENIVLALQARRGVTRPLSRREQDEIAAKFIRLLDIRPPDPERPIGLLSGGNQQKALLARWLATQPRLLILDEPTRGIDVGAHAEIIALIRRLCAQGMALLVVSSELEEIVTYADEVIVLRDRAHVARLTGDDITVPGILAAIAEADPAQPPPAAAGRAA
ncbi:sugar ABC transporter ATP-binding protein [Ancylobacter defluvii]|uniref:Sugar ABC transporter ATP-binding protein n=1 Tax=Ancylobacter defluvii TaxID=1282440 RepID=A0A9W6JWQ1_9HYPH|nr:sugar ABC transporter ATP-binding protein [Ancylobacter defluvii]MBS7590394.1 sugar ABC transporter ATP-binding protein [Ancylobacter defluvii]GLK83314.1 sugar ABC transporter ATP-binding protein [Ancylobacter defluvii]